MLTVTILGSQSWLKITQNQQFSGSSISTSTCQHIWGCYAWRQAACSATKKHLSVNNGRAHIWEKQFFQCRHPTIPGRLYDCEHVSPLRKPSTSHELSCYKTPQKKRSAKCSCCLQPLSTPSPWGALILDENSFKQAHLACCAQSSIAIAVTEAVFKQKWGWVPVREPVDTHLSHLQGSGAAESKHQAKLVQYTQSERPWSREQTSLPLCKKLQKTPLFRAV